jgi:hypothetical protein
VIPGHWYTHADETLYVLSGDLVLDGLPHSPGTFFFEAFVRTCASIGIRLRGGRGIAGLQLAELRLLRLCRRVDVKTAIRHAVAGQRGERRGL